MRSSTGIWLAATSKAPIAATTLIVPKAGRPNSWDEIAVVRAPARAPPTTVAGIQAQAIWPAEVRSTQACAPPATAPAAASAGSCQRQRACHDRNVLTYGAGRGRRHKEAKHARNHDERVDKARSDGGRYPPIDLEAVSA